MTNSLTNHNDAAIALRISMRKLHGCGATASTTYSLMRRAPPQYIGALGSLKEPHNKSDVLRFWTTAFFRMRRHGLDAQQRRHIASEMVRKGAPPPAAAQAIDHPGPAAVPHWPAVDTLNPA